MNIDSVVSTINELVQRGLRPIMNSSSGLPAWLALGSTHIAKIVSISCQPTRNEDYILCKATLEIDGKTVISNLPIVSLAGAAFDRQIQVEVGSYTARNSTRASRVLNITGIANSGGVIQPTADIATPAVMAGVLKITPAQYEQMTAPPTAAAVTSPQATPALTPP